MRQMGRNPVPEPTGKALWRIQGSSATCAPMDPAQLARPLAWALEASHGATSVVPRRIDRRRLDAILLTTGFNGKLLALTLETLSNAIQVLDHGMGQAVSFGGSESVVSRAWHGYAVVAGRIVAVTQKDGP